MDNQTAFRLAVGCYSEPVGHAPTAHGTGVAIVEIDLVSGEATNGRAMGRGENWGDRGESNSADPVCKGPGFRFPARDVGEGSFP